MTVWRRFRTTWRNLSRPQEADCDLDNELRSYRELLEDEKVGSGLTAAQARREAQLEIGSASLIQEQVRDVRLGVTLGNIAAEIRQSLRSLRRTPGLTIIGTLMLAVGMGASTVVFSIFHAALIRPLPFRDPGRLVELFETRLHRGINQASFSEANFWDLRSLNHSFEEMGAYHDGEANLIGIGAPEKISASSVTPGFFRTLGITPVIGRDFEYDEGRRGGPRVLILGNKFWKNRFSGDPSILGRTLRLNDTAYTVVGILPPGRRWIDDQTYIPFGYRANADRGSWEFNVVGRLKPGVTAEAARSDLQHVAAILSAAYPADDRGMGFDTLPSSSWVASAVTRRALWILLAAVGLLLLIACLNIANLLLSRGLSRRREIAVRTALGAGRARLVRFVMMESILLSVLGGVAGLALAYAALPVIRTLDIRGISSLPEANLNPWVLAFSGAIAILTGLLSGVAPALQAPVSVALALREGDRQTGSCGQGRLRAILVAGEVALSFLLLVGAGLLTRSLDRLMNVQTGFRIENRLLFSVSLPGSYWENGRGKQFVDRFIERIGSMPGVQSVGSVSNRPIEGGDPGMGIGAVTGPQIAERDTPWAGWRIVTPGYFSAVGLRLQKGRLFDQRDEWIWGKPGQPSPIRHVILSERLAKTLFRDTDPIGQHVELWKGQSSGDAEVIGVVSDMRERGLSARMAMTVYLPTGLQAVPSEFIVHTQTNPTALMPSIRAALAELDSNLPIYGVRTFEEVIDRSVAQNRFNTVGLGVFAGIALLLAVTGIYGVLAYSMSRRASEIGLRVALGASPSSIRRMTLTQGMRPVVAGLVAGAVAAWGLSKSFTALLFDVKPFDLITYAAVAGVLLLAALLACYLPARNAMQVDPAIALRIG
jgi:putative ABC transport system permease protein